MEQQFLASLEAGCRNSLLCVQLIRRFFVSQEDKCKDKINKNFFRASVLLQFCFGFKNNGFKPYLFIYLFKSNSVQFSSVQFSFISAPPHEQNNKMLKSLCVVKDKVRKRKKQQNELTLCLAN